MDSDDEDYFENYKPLKRKRKNPAASSNQRKEKKSIKKPPTQTLTTSQLKTISTQPVTPSQAIITQSNSRIPIQLLKTPTLTPSRVDKQAPVTPQLTPSRLPINPKFSTLFTPSQISPEKVKTLNSTPSRVPTQAQKTASGITPSNVNAQQLILTNMPSNLCPSLPKTPCSKPTPKLTCTNKPTGKRVSFGVADEEDSLTLYDHAINRYVIYKSLCFLLFLKYCEFQFL